MRRQRQVALLVAIVFGLLAQAIAEHRRVSEAVPGIEEALELGPDVGGAADAAEVGDRLLDRAVLPEVLDILVDRSGQDPEEEVAARIHVSHLQRRRLDRHADLTVSRERLTDDLETEPAR